MKTTILLVMLLTTYTISAQLTITPGAQFSIAGNIQLTLDNTDLVNNGSFTTGNNTTRFTGNISSSISGSQPVQFNELEINKTNNSSVLLQQTIDVKQRILFSSGFLNLNGFDADLGATGNLDGEQEATRVTGPNGGAVLFNVDLNSPINSNPANLGLFITAGANLGNVTIKRGHQSQVNGSGIGNTILRYYDIIPANNINLNATLRFKYFDGELNGLNENSIILFENLNSPNWTALGFTTRDIVANFVEINNISSFAKFTLSDANNPLPVSFISLNAQCEQNNILITWKTAQEQNSSHFNIERSVDGLVWTPIGNLPAAGNSSNERSYSFADNNRGPNNFYRIAEYDLNGKVQYSKQFRPSCNQTDVFRLWPNPVPDRVFVNIVSGNQSQAILKIFDNKGALVKVQKVTLLPGSNQFSVDMSTLAKGVYSFVAEWNNGQIKKTVQVFKQ